MQRKAQEWGDNVEVVCSDMRTWRLQQGVDIIVSELLGSFGDNELSPECLDGVQEVLKRMCSTLYSIPRASISDLYVFQPLES